MLEVNKVRILYTILTHNPQKSFHKGVVCKKLIQTH